MQSFNYLTYQIYIQQTTYPLQLSNVWILTIPQGLCTRVSQSATNILDNIQHKGQEDNNRLRKSVNA